MTREENNKKLHRKIDFLDKKEDYIHVLFIIVKIIILLFIIIVGFYFYIINISTLKIITKEYRIIDEGLPDNFNGFKVVQFSDIHYKSKKDLNIIENMVNEINKRNPDLVIFTGDLIDNNNDINDDVRNKIIDLLNKINSKYGKYASVGDEDSNEFNLIMSKTNFNVLDNNIDYIYNGNSNPIALIGLSSNDKQDLDYVFDNLKDDNLFSILFVHKPQIIDRVNYNISLSLSGHNLNGEINIPIINNIISKETKYLNSFYKLDNTRLYVSSGIGTNNIDIRFFNHPSINFFRISNN